MAINFPFCKLSIHPDEAFIVFFSKGINLWSFNFNWEYAAENSGLDVKTWMTFWLENTSFQRCKGTRTHCCGHIVAHDVSLRAQTGKHLLRTQNVSEQNQKHRPQCVRNNVSSFASSLIVLMWTRKYCSLHRASISILPERFNRIIE